MSEVQITPQSANTFIIKLGVIELNVYCSSDEYISIRSNVKIEYPEVLMDDITSKDSVRFVYDKK